MTYMDRQQVRSFLETLGNAARWGIWFAIVVSLITTLCYIASQTNNVHLMFVLTIGAIWISVYAGIDLKLEFP